VGEVSRALHDLEMGAVAGGRRLVAVVEEPAAHVDQGVGSPLGGGAHRLAVGVGGDGGLDGLVDHRATLGRQLGVEAPATVGALRQVTAGGFTRLGIGVDHRLGPGRPLAGDDDRVGHAQRRQHRHQLGLDLGEQGQGPIAHVGQHGLHLVGRQRAVDGGGLGDGQRSQAAGLVHEGPGRGTRLAGVGTEPRRHRRGAIEFVELLCVETTDDLDQQGSEPVEELEGPDQFHWVAGHR